ncbi:hypothetical protein ABEB36_015034 [Hypothenemus hampei]|uniref:Uncharacterized protein n=1 Tax=Hypothenemus hampei TaxID=57062 RepID=A0ABD1E1M1_HYPHA
MIRYLHHVIHYQKNLEYIHVTFPIRSHSYMECDKDFSLINQKRHAETPEDWITTFQSARIKPAPFNVESVHQYAFLNWELHLNKLYKKICPFPTRPIREIKLSKDCARLIYFRTSFHGSWKSSDIVGKSVKLNNKREFDLPQVLYEVWRSIGSKKKIANFNHSSVMEI